ncbi:NAD(P)H-dependent flavin oxidoreductase YrpB (nitropropane dioxygenase family) [Pseudarthrobacter siccitolerans]|uniref:NAD(P)H-dependent flavin oxidoreductase YrpB (Nitropropane dioxygenase family) n=1 Tax=Pseudarthrobacter siccitolerans TaxID=861266 RepID=A0ABU0PL53_9MICC|nr:nitronate monooxygenase [Pseudarthrobacter siccitolerans]MDQ0674697.1 NAD(P)H-dependent flavin oxidoreductase YrpB (nitropropane dioxygenase family) [Pseudarthrobacter siccitolerans]
MIRTKLTELLGIDNPLVGFSRSPRVVTEVTNAGGFGVLAASAYSPEELDAQLSWIEEQVKGRPYGVDMLIPGKTAAGNPNDLIASLRAQIPQEHIDFVAGLLKKYGVPEATEFENKDELSASVNPEGAMALVDVAFTHKISLIANALGTPPPVLVERGHKEGVAVAALVGQAKHAVRQLESGVDILVAQGYEAGGHTGTIAGMVLTPEIVAIAGDVPVLTAGAMASGRQMAAAIALGASGAWAGSVWLNSHEDITPIEIKQKFLAASSNDTLRSPTRTGKPARQLRSAWHDEWEAEGAPKPLPMPLQPMLANAAWESIDQAAAQGNEGALKLESFFIGQVVGSFTELRGAGDITREILADCEQRLKELSELVADTQPVS